MTFDQDFQQTVFDYFGIEAQRHGEIMATLSDILAQVTALNTALDTKVAASTDAVTSLRSSVDKTLADLADTGAAGHAAVLDKIGAALKDTQSKVDSLPLPETIKGVEGEVMKKISAVPVPSPAV